MAISRTRLASRQEITRVFGAGVALVHSWTVLVFLKQLPAWLLSLDAWDLVGIFAYAQSLALLESATIVLIMILLSAVLPARFLREQFIARSSALLFVTSGWALVAQYDPEIVPRFSPGTVYLWLPAYLASLGVVYLMLRRYRRLEAWLGTLAERLSVLLYVYVPIALFSMIVIVLRNV